MKVRTVLGIANSHDAGAALVQDGKILAAVNEERLNRKKMSSGFPALSIEAIWKISGLKPADVDLVAVGGKFSSGNAIPLNNDFTNDDGSSAMTKRMAELLDSSPGGQWVLSNQTAHRLYQGVMPIFKRKQFVNLQRYLHEIGILAPVESFGHHAAHAASAYFTGGEPDALVISNDGFGDGHCSLVAEVDNRSRLLIRSTNHFVNSLGVYYNYVTHFCGFSKSHHAGKTTGLAALGDPGKTISIFQALIQWDEESGAYVNRGKLFGNCLKDIHEKLAGFSKEDAAAGIQRHCEDLLTSLVRHYMVLTGKKRVELTGGIHANVKVNQRIAEIPGVESVFVFPNMGDGGLALGAAYLAYAGVSPGVLPMKLDHVYFGPSFTEKEISACLLGVGVSFSKPANLAFEVARQLRDNKIVARFDGAMEYGPRALGNRSILYPATNSSVNQWLNIQLRRTEFMPFAPVVRAKDATIFFKNFDNRTAYTAEFMTITYDVTDRCKKEAPAIVHVDGTARPQVLRREVNPGYYDILEEYHKLTGLSILVNTSFNMHEEPIVCTPHDAVKAFFESNLDVLVIGPFMVINY